MSFTFKGNEDTNPHLWSLSNFLQNSSSSVSNTTVEMEDIDEQLRMNIRSILHSISEETINGIIHAVKYAGLESLSDLQFVREEDLILVLRPIQRRKLVKAWTEKNNYNYNVMSSRRTSFRSSYRNDVPSANSISYLPEKKCKWSKSKRFILLRVCAKYKTELAQAHPDTERHEVWKKIANEVQQRSSSNCNELQCMEKLAMLRRQYENIKKAGSISQKKIIFFQEAMNAFEDSENSDAPSSQVNETSKIGKYIPPHLRNGEIKSESVISSKDNVEPLTIKVRNLSKDVRESDLKELFAPFGTISRIYMIKDNNGEFKGFAYIKFHKTEDAARAIEATNQTEYNKFILKVEWAQKTEVIYDDTPAERTVIVSQVPILPPFHQAKPSSFMNGFKKIYSNEGSSEGIKYFWDNFDTENYSIWFCEYLYPNELTLVFMSCNLIEGMFQRLNKLNKNAFASMCIFGEDNNSTISGIWVWRGHELIFTLSSDWQVDYESYSWRQLVPFSDEARKLVNEYFTWSGEFGGKKFAQGKIFK